MTSNSFSEYMLDRNEGLCSSRKHVKDAHSTFTLHSQVLQTTQASRTSSLWYIHTRERFVVYSCGGMWHGSEKGKTTTTHNHVDESHTMLRRRRQTQRAHTV